MLGFVLGFVLVLGVVLVLGFVLGLRSLLGLGFRSVTSLKSVYMQYGTRIPNCKYLVNNTSAARATQRGVYYTLYAKTYSASGRGQAFRLVRKTYVFCMRGLLILLTVLTHSFAY